MADLLKGNRRTLHDHMTPSGDVVVWSFVIRALDVSAGILAQITINIHASNAMSVTGNLGVIGVSLLDNAVDAARGYHQRAGGLLVPGADVEIDGVQGVAKLTIEGPVEDRTYAVAVLQAARAAITPKVTA